jgi:hypothetical protein
MAAHSSVPTAPFLNRITAPARSDGVGVVVYLNVKMRVLSLPSVTVNTS